MTSSGDGKSTSRLCHHSHGHILSRIEPTSNNKVVLEYVENLNRLIDKLDGVESGGYVSVREQRKQMIRNVEAEAQRMDRWIAAVWKLPTQPPAQAPAVKFQVSKPYALRLTGNYGRRGLVIEGIPRISCPTPSASGRFGRSFR